MRNSGDLCFPHKGLNETGSLSKFCMPSTAVSASLLLVHMWCGAGSNAQNPLEVGTCCRELATQFFGESCTPTVFVCVCSVVQSCLTLYNPMNHTTQGFPVLHYLLELGQTHVHWIGDAIQPSHPYHPLLLPPSVFPSIRVFSNESALHIRWPNYWSFSFSISPSKDYSGLISFRLSFLSKGLSRVFFNTIVWKALPFR